MIRGARVDMKPGSRWRSAACGTEVIVVQASGDAHALECGGLPMVPFDEAGEPAGSPVVGFDQGTLLGKRYTDEAGTIELLCTKPGGGSLALGGAALDV